MYGHPVKFNFAQSGDNHKTTIGGFFSIVINILIWSFVGYKFKKLLFLEENKDTLHVKSIDLEEYGKVNFTQMNFTMFSNIAKQLPNHQSKEIWLNQTDLEKYVRFNY